MRKPQLGPLLLIFMLTLSLPLSMGIAHAENGASTAPEIPEFRILHQHYAGQASAHPVLNNSNAFLQSASELRSQMSTAMLIETVRRKVEKGGTSAEIISFYEEQCGQISRILDGRSQKLVSDQWVQLILDRAQFSINSVKNLLGYNDGYIVNFVEKFYADIFTHALAIANNPYAQLSQVEVGRIFNSVLKGQLEGLITPLAQGKFLLLQIVYMTQDLDADPHRNFPSIMALRAALVDLRSSPDYETFLTLLEHVRLDDANYILEFNRVFHSVLADFNQIRRDSIKAFREAGIVGSSVPTTADDE